MVRPDRPQMIISKMRFACWINKATDTNSEYVIFNVFYCKNIYANAHRYYVYTYNANLVNIKLQGT